MSFIYTTAIDKLREVDSRGKRIRVVPGGTSAGKTYGIIPILIDLAASKSGEEISIVSESVPHLRRGAIKDFLKIMVDTGRYIDSHWNRTLLTYTFSTGSYIEFFSADQPDRVRGPRRTQLYINEANNIAFDTFDQLLIRTSGSVWIDFNPTNQFWAHEELVNDSDAEWLTLTYKDNEGLPEPIVKDIEKRKAKAFKNPNLPYDELFQEANIISSYWANWWKVYGMGMVGSLEGVIFSNWSIIDELPKEARRIGYGIDFGYTNDPSTCMVAYEFNGVRIWDEVIYSTGLLNPDIAERLAANRLTRFDRGYADSAEPKSIAEINKNGFNIKPVEKGSDSIRFGINIMQSEPFQITARSVNAIEELRNYCWDTDKTGKNLNRPIDAFNHCIDAMRYFEMMAKLKPKPKPIKMKF